MLFSSVAPCYALLKYGVIDSNGHWVIPARYQNIKYLGDGIYLATNFKNGSTMFPVGKAFLLDAAGEPFHIDLPEGCGLNGPLLNMTNPAKNRSDILLVITKDRHQGVCDINGKIVIPPIYDSIKSYSEGYFVVLTGDSKSTAFLDKDAQVLGKMPTSEFDFHLNEFHEGVVLGEASKRLYLSGGAGYLASFQFFHPDGTPLRLPPLCSASEFSEGYAAVQVSDIGRRPLYAAMIDKQGKILSNKKFAFISAYRFGRACAAIEIDKKILFGVIEHTGNFVIQPAYSRIQVNSDHSYIATAPDGDVLIDSGGRLICKYQEKLELIPSETSLHRCVLLSRKSVPKGYYGIPAYADESGHVYDENTPLPKGEVVPVWQTNKNGCFFGLRRDSKWITETSFRVLDRLPNNQWLAILESTKFDKSDWTANLDRDSLFHCLLRERNLIGMSRSDLVDLLGNGTGGRDWLFYNLSCNVFCGNAASGVLFDMANDRVKRWRIVDGIFVGAPKDLNDTGWFSENVAFPNSTYDAAQAKVKMTSLSR